MAKTGQRQASPVAYFARRPNAHLSFGGGGAPVLLAMQELPVRLA